MLVLVLDSSSAAVTAAVTSVAADGTVDLLAEVVTVNARGHGELLAPSIERALADAGVAMHALAAIVAGTGPGPYTGLRVGLVSAAVMGEALGIPTYGVCSLDGFCAPGAHGSLLVLTDARRKEVYWARYSCGARVDGPAVARPAEVSLDGIDEVSGEGAILYGIGAGTPAVRYPDAAHLARRAADRIAGGAASERLTPLYLRRPDAVAPGAPKAVTQ